MADLARYPLRPFVHAIWPLSHFIGYRHPNHSLWPSLPPPESGRIARWLHSDQGHKAEKTVRCMIGSWVMIAVMSFVSRSCSFRGHHTPIVVGSFGAQAVVLLSNPKNPFAQPRAAILGNTFSAILAVAITKLFLKSSHFMLGTPDGIAWANAALCMGLSFGMMELFNIAHPPGGATAVLAAILPEIVQMGWFFVAVILIDTLIMVGLALIINNLGRDVYPTYWISPSLFKDREEKEQAGPSGSEKGSTDREGAGDTTDSAPDGLSLPEPAVCKGGRRVSVEEGKRVLAQERARDRSRSSDRTLI